MYEVSIIIPVYNSEKYISRCIDSILKNNFDNYEIILMNDGSTDNSRKICEEYCNKYRSFIKLYNKKNQGVAKTRNEAIGYASGKYVMFIDNDDWIDDSYIQVYVNEAKKRNCDAVFGGYERVNEKNEVLNRVILTEKHEFSKYKIVAPWAKIYKRDFLINNNIKFLDSNIGEDIYFNFQVVNTTKKISIINNTGYKWFYNETSISNTLHKKISNKLQFNYLLDELYKVNNNSNEINEYFFLKTITWYIFYILNSNDFNAVLSEKRHYDSWLKKFFPNYRKNRYLKLFGPSGENAFNGLAIYILMKIKFLNLNILFLKLVKKRRKKYI